MQRFQGPNGSAFHQKIPKVPPHYPHCPQYYHLNTDHLLQYLLFVIDNATKKGPFMHIILAFYFNTKKYSTYKHY